ncbi:MAG: Ppx/GppA phosphatase family protein [Myxococcota bacterium]
MSAGGVAPTRIDGNRRGRRVAAIDIGTNSVLLLVAEARDGDVAALEERAEITRLGKDVDADGNLSSDAIARTVEVLREYAARAEAWGATEIAAVATSAARDAGNGADFLARAEGALGTRPDIVSGLREAHLTYAGATMGLETRRARHAVFDVGGGSTEIIVDHGQGLEATSLDIGAVRLTERFIRDDDPPTEAALRELDAYVATALGNPDVPDIRSLELVGVAGTVTTLAAIAAGLAPYRPGALHGTRLKTEAVRGIVSDLAQKSVEARKSVPGLAPGRADVIVAGGRIVHALCAHAGAAALTVSERGVRWGLAQERLQSAAGG